MIPITIDDAYITFTYAKNLAKGNGLVFGTGEYVEATSSLLWALLLTPFELLGIGSVVSSKLLGILFFTAALTLTYRLVQTQIPQPKEWPISPALLATGVAAVGGPFIVWTPQGMENPLVAFLLVWALFLFSREAVGKGTVGSAVPLFLLEVARPEGFIFWILLAGGKVILCAGFGTITKRAFLKWVFALFTLIGTYEAWGLYYYGRLLPNTVGAKVGSFDLARLWDGLLYVTAPAALPTFFLCLFVMAGALVLLYRESFKNPSKLAKLFECFFPAVVLIGAVTAFSVATGGDWMPGCRFLSHLAPLLGVAFTTLLAYASESVSQASVRVKSAWVLGSLAVLGCAGLFSINHQMDQTRYIHIFSEKAVNPILEYTNRIAKDGDLLACSDVGRPGYYFKGKIFDWWGLASPEVVAKGEALGGIRADTVLRHRPRFIILYSGSPDIFDEKGTTGFGAMSRTFLENEDFKKSYRSVITTYFTYNRYHVLFERIAPTG